MRDRLFPLTWSLLWPARRYVQNRHARGRRIVFRGIIEPLLPREPWRFERDVPNVGRMRLSPHDAIGMSVLLYGDYEPAEIAYMRNQVSPKSVAIDIGANVGTFSLAMADAGASVWAIEPDPSNLERLRVNTSLNPGRSIEVIGVAVGDRDGSLTVYVGSDGAMTSINQASNQRASRPISVPMTTIDAIWSQRGKPNVSMVKMDIDGAEVMAVNGMKELLATCRPRLMIEINGGENERALLESLAPMSYQRIHPDGFSRSNFIFAPT